MKLLLHACCGPCSLEPLRLLREEGHDATIYYANSNIAPAEEYAKRLATLRAWASSEDVCVREGVYAPDVWEASVGRRGDAALAEAVQRTLHESTPSDEALASCALAVAPQLREDRCRACYRLRFEETARAARDQGFDAMGTTLSVSPYQYTEIIHEELARAANHHNVASVFRDYRPYYDEATRRSREANMYRQNYCGCRFSAAEAAAERAERKAARDEIRASERSAHAAEQEEAEIQRAAKRAKRQAYDDAQAKKRAIRKALRNQKYDPRD